MNYYVRAMKNDELVFETAREETLDKLTQSINDYIVDIDNEITLSIFKGEEEIGYFQSAPDGLFPCKDEKLIED